VINQRGIPSHQCINCGGEWFRVLCRFEDYEIAQYIVEAFCEECGAEVDAPTLPDHPYWDPEKKEITKPLPPLDD
jgi:hypothetical protein